MKYVISIVASIVGFFVMGIFLDESTRMNGDEILIMASMSGISVFAVLMMMIKRNKDGTELASDAIRAATQIKEKIEANLEDGKEALYAQAEKEYEEGEIDKGLWSKALVKAKGDESLRKVEYMKLRVKQLRNSAS